MKKYLTIVLAIGAMISLFSSCKKTTDFTIITGHKWSLSTALETYSDSGAHSNNLLNTSATCTSSSYTQYYNNSANSPLKLAYTYSTSNCPGQTYMPDLGVSSWNIDPDNTALYVNGNTTDGTGGTWYTIATLNGSSMVLTQVYQSVIGYTTSTPPTALYHTVTDTYTFTAM